MKNLVRRLAWQWFRLPPLSSARSFCVGCLMVSIAFGLGAAQTAQAQEKTINQALAQFYASNPSLESIQISIGVENEKINQVSGAAMPQISLGVNANPSRTYAYGLNSGESIQNVGNLGLSVNLTQAVDISGSIGTQIESAYMGLESGWINYYYQEQNLLLEAIKTYMNVISSRADVSLNNAAVGLLGAQLKAAKARYDAGVGTSTDIANINASYQGARAELVRATGSRSIAEAEYYRVFGTAPGTLNFPASVPNLPRSLSQAVDRAMNSAPAFLQAEMAVQMKRLDLAAVKASNGPSLNLTASASHSYDLLDDTNDHSTNFSAGGQFNMPLYQGGAGHSRVRQAQLDYQGAISQLEAQREVTRAQVVAAWQNLQILETALDSIVAQVDAAELALKGARAEQNAGTKTFLDTLNAENALTSAQVRLSTTRADLVVAGYALLQATGDLTAQKLHLPVAAYFDPESDLNQRFVPNIASALYLPGEDRSTVSPSFTRWLNKKY